jgi:serine O-acetyltransferase
MNRASEADKVAGAAALSEKNWSDPDPGRPIPFWASLHADIVGHIPVEQRTCSRGRWALLTLGVLFGSAGFRVVGAYRLSHTLGHRAGLPGRVMAGFIFWAIRHVYYCTISPRARLHGGIILPHPQGIVIGAGSAIGPRAWIFQNVTLGGAPGKEGLPQVGCDARIFAGAVLTGPIRVGDNVMIGANAVVARDVPDRSLVRCSEAEIVPLSERFLSEGI